MTLIAFILLFLVGVALAGAAIIGLIRIWIKHEEQPEPLDDLPCSVCGDPNCFDMGHLAQIQQAINEARALLPPGTAIEIEGDPRQASDNELLTAIRHALDISGAYRFPTTPPAPYDWKADRGLR